jgi:hypothetical protein
MGRVARYKKIRTCDPFSKKNGGRIDLSTVGIWGLGDNGRKLKKKSRTAERLKCKAKRIPFTKGKDRNNRNNKSSIINNNNNNSIASGGFDLPPDEADEFDLNDLTGSIQTQRGPIALIDDDQNGKGAPSSSNMKLDTNDPTVIQEDKIVTSTGNTASIPKTDRDEAKVNRLLKLDKQVADKEERKKLDGHARMDGESKRAYARRTKVETRQIIKKTTTIKNPEKLQRKKEFLKNKKKNKKGRGTSNAAFDDEDGNDDGWAMDGRSKSDSHSSLVTGERAMAAMKADPVHFGEQAERPPVFRQLPRGARQSNESDNTSWMKTESGKSKGMTTLQVAEEQDAMEMMRRRVQAQYAAIKLKRRQDGDFHL